MAYINVGYGNLVNTDKIYSIVSPDSAPIKRLIQKSKETESYIDATCGKKTKSVIIMEDDIILLSALNTETLASRLNQ
ncbi:DUF370 domain-containing protein [Eubacterium xylanophilum]|uniref:DUF370 domain-containing protein n=1 Tax=Eubacterium xylanophilum TaxID=39497 RepID=UPI00047C2863|nr:DUF370 domain-containing protein [Eubacterium xylanophilum]MCR5796726.1 DUF370 domain-containing protein [Eubacterium sp.]